MHPDLVKLIDLQSKDAEVAAREQRLAELKAETAVLDEVLKRAQDLLEKARQTAADAQRRRDELETKIDSYRILQDRRRLRLEQVRNPKDASTLMTCPAGTPNGPVVSSWRHASAAVSRWSGSSTQPGLVTT